MIGGGLHRLPTLGPAGSPGSPPPVSRDGAQSAAQLELSKHAYHRHDPSLADRGFRWVLHKFGDALESAARHAPGKGIGLLVIVVAVAVVVVLVTVRVGRLRRSVKATQPLLGHQDTSPTDHRQRAEAFADEEQWAPAVREWLRATSRELEERGLLDPRPGRTAAELCVEAAAGLPAVAEDLRQATSVFDSIWYGGRPATSEDEQLLHRLDQRVAGSHRTLAARP